MSALAGLTGVVLAGGEGSRMGADKAFVEVEGVPMIERVVRVLRACCSEVLIVAKEPAAYEHLRLRVIPDRSAIQAPLVGVCGGLGAAATPWAFVAACDMPYLSPDAVRLLAGLAEGFDAAVPRVQGRWHPLHAVYATSTLPLFEEHLAKAETRMWAALEALRVRQVTAAELETVDPGLCTLINVNTVQEHRAVTERRRPGGSRHERIEE
ncbi:MAG: molybdenum cofactor guanylyltransferase [Armatimonadetes bacterium]|nr:molybdenum cofactor guanylyltransferase [Armatimonadota bacterium]